MARTSYVVKRLVCPKCEQEGEQLVNRDAPPLKCTTCHVELLTPGAMAPRSPAIVDDVLWGGPQYVHNITDKPIFVRTKTEYNALLAAHGLKQRVRHVPVPGTDKSPITTTWDIGLPPGVDPRPFAMLSKKEQAARRKDAAKRFGCSVRELAAIGRRRRSDTSRIELKSDPTPACEFFPDRD